MRDLLGSFILYFVLSLCVGCGTPVETGTSHSDTDAEQEFDGIVQTAPLFLCPPGKLVAGTNTSGQPVCQIAEAPEDTSSRESDGRPVYFGRRPSKEFICPSKSFLKGFDSQGKAVCQTQKKKERSTEVERWVSEESLAQIAHLKGQLCSADEFVIGYDEFKNLICSPDWTTDKNKD